MKIKPFAEQGNFVQVHNYLFDEIMPALPPNAWKVLCFIIRKTRGWNKTADQISYTQIVKGTGIKGSATVSAALKTLVSERYILATHGDKWEAVTYQLNTQFEATLASEIEATPTSEIEAGLASEIEDTKDTLKNKKDSGGSGGKKTPPKQPATAAVSDEEAFAELKADPAYAHLDFDHVHRKMIAWCKANDRTPTLDRLRDWLNKERKPLVAVPSPHQPNSISSKSQAEVEALVAAARQRRAS